jgi:hypothetical protein
MRGSKVLLRGIIARFSIKKGVLYYNPEKGVTAVR